MDYFFLGGGVWMGGENSGFFLDGEVGVGLGWAAVVLWKGAQFQTVHNNNLHSLPMHSSFVYLNSYFGGHSDVGK